jgi:type IV secretory pathway VirB10-like protein
MQKVFTHRRVLGVIATLALVGAAALGCNKDEKKAEGAAPAASASAPAKPAASPATEKASAAPAASSAAPKKAKAAAKKAPTEKVAAKAPKEVPTEWEERDHEEKGFSFWVPKGVKESQDSADGVDVYVAQLPAPHDKIGVFVMAFKDPAKKFPELTKITEDLIKKVDTGTEYKVEKTVEINDSYQVLEISYKDKAGKKNSVKALMALDVSDRYIMIVGGEGELKDSEETVDTILANFEMYASGKGE